MPCAHTHRNASRQRFCLSSPLRQSRMGRQRKRFFEMTRYEACRHNAFRDHFSLELGICMCRRAGHFVWVTEVSPHIMTYCTVQCCM